MRIVEEGALRPLIDMVRFPDTDMQRCSSLAVNAVALGPQAVTKTSVMHEEGLLPLMALVDGNDQDCIRAGVYALGTLCEDDEVKARIVELGAIASVVHQVGLRCFPFKALVEKLNYGTSLLNDSSTAKLNPNSLKLDLV